VEDHDVLDARSKRQTVAGRRVEPDRLRRVDRSRDERVRRVPRGARRRDRRLHVAVRVDDELQHDLHLDGRRAGRRSRIDRRERLGRNDLREGSRGGEDDRAHGECRQTTTRRSGHQMTLN